MKHPLPRLLLAAALAAASCGAAVHAELPDAQEAMRTADAIMYPASFSMNVTIATERRGRVESSMEMDVAHREGMGSFLELLSPPRSKGTRFLQTQGALWMYSPQSGSRATLRLSPRESFQGSVFSNNDMSDTTWANDYAAGLLGSASVDSPDFGHVETWLISGKALRRDVPYGEIRLYLRKDGLLPLRVEYYAKSGLLLKTMELSDYALSAGRLRPRRMVMTAADGTGERSTVRIRDLRERTDLPAAMFNQAWLVR
ncbi:MAG: outer membrane lipoprotein-sorting protein [Rectinemataceae bacterium]